MTIRLKKGIIILKFYLNTIRMVLERMSNDDGVRTSSISLKSVVQPHIALVASFLCKLSKNCCLTSADNKLINYFDNVMTKFIVNNRTGA